MNNSKRLDIGFESLQEISSALEHMKPGRPFRVLKGKKIRRLRAERSDKKAKAKVRISQQADDNLIILCTAYDLKKSRILSDICQSVLADQDLLISVLRHLKYPGASFKVKGSQDKEKGLRLRLDE